MESNFGFELVEEKTINEIKTRARLYRHIHSGARLLSLENEDENKVFGITFRTPPTDSTGVAHIMEHCVLCGSQKYPVKEPFIELVKGSLNTFLNAFTYPDKTCYPVASQNLQDFYNLVDVYVDAVFHPLLSEYMLQQEGWHYELETLDSPLSYKGVVFNEMKGAYSNPDDLIEEFARQSLFPDNTYAVDYGGHPRHIPELTYPQFKAFHENYYHPSNSYIYFYGDDNPDERLRRMDHYLQGFEAIQVDSAIPLQPQFSEPRRMEISFDPGDESEGRKGRLLVNWLLAETSEAETELGLSILGHILLGTPASPLRKALIDSGLGEDLAGGGLEDDLRQAYFSTGLKGIAVEPDNQLADKDKIETLIWQTLEELVHGGIDPDTVMASMNTVEFRLREMNTGSFPRGLLLMLRALSGWLYDRDPFEPLGYEQPLEAIKKRLESGEKYFEKLISHYLLENPHRTIIVMQPKPGLNQMQDEEEQKRLKDARAGLSEVELKQVIENAELLKNIQETPDPPDALATIPRLNLGDLEKEIKQIPLELEQEKGSRLLYHDLFTNGIVYLDVGFDLHTLPQEMLPYISLYGRALVEIGTETQDFVRLSQRIGQVTGGISSSTLATQVREADRSEVWLFLRSKATTAQADGLLSILKDILLTVKLDNRERFKQMVLEEKAQLETGLVPAGHRVVNTRLRAMFNEADWAEEQMSGVDYLFFIRELAEAVERDWTSVLNRLEQVHHILVNRQASLCNITLDSENFMAFKPKLDRFLDSLPSFPVERAVWQPKVAPINEGLTIPAQVNYVGKGADLYKTGYQLHGSISVINKYLGTTWLWERVRIQGGAYGGFSLFNHRSGVFTFLSYRDPNLLTTLENYDQSANFLKELQLDDEELVKSIIGTIGDLDAYLLPDAKGNLSLVRYLSGDTDESRQQWRDQVLGTKETDFHAFGETLANIQDQYRVVVLGSAEAIQTANAERNGWLQVNRVL